MANLIQPNSVKVVTKEGEIVVSLQIDLNINLNTMNVTTDVEPKNLSSTKPEKKQEEDASWMIPEFKTSEKIKFGK
jgi:hypothetical protein